jgi:hypothetical protein
MMYVLYFKLNGIDATNRITKFRISERTSVSIFRFQGKFHDSFGVGNPQYNDEIEMSMVTIDGLLDNKYWSYMSYLIQQGVCGHDVSINAL